MQMTAYVNFKGQCEAAFKFYERCFGAEPGPIFRYGGSPMVDQVPRDWQDKVMHGSATSPTPNGSSRSSPPTAAW